MPFINELVPESDKLRIDWTPYKGWDWSDSHPPRQWTIDRERDIFFIYLEGQGREKAWPETFALGWHGQFIRLEMAVASDGVAFDETLTYSLLQMDLPADCEAERDTILAALREAIQAYGCFYTWQHLKQVHIAF